MLRSFTVICLVLLLLAACSETNSPLGVDPEFRRTSVSSGRLTVNPDRAEIKIGEHLKLAVARVPNRRGKAKVRPHVRWASSNSQVARVNRRGRVTGLSAGSAVITATSRKHGEGYATITVKAPKPPTPPPPPPPPEPANLAPAAVAPAAETVEDNAVEIVLHASDPDGDMLDFILGTPAHGTVEPLDDADCSEEEPSVCTQEIRYTPTQDYAGSDEFSFTVSDDSLTADALVSLTITPVNDAPVARPDTVHASGTGTMVFDVLANDLDPDGDALTITAVDQFPPWVGTTAIVDGKVQVTLAQANSFFVMHYTMSDGVSESSTEIVVSINNHTPVPQPDDVVAHANTATLLDVLVNDTDPDGDAMTLVSFSAGLPAPNQGGTVVVVDGKVRYTPKQNFTGVETFQYLVTDGIASAVGSVTVTVGNAPPVAQNDNLTVDLRAQNVEIDVLANDSDADGDPLTLLSLGTLNGGGTASIVGGRVRYTPAGTPREEAFSYTISDGPSLTNGWVYVTVADVIGSIAADLLGQNIGLLEVVRALKVEHGQSAANAYAIIAGVPQPPDTRAVLAAVCDEFGLDQDIAPPFGNVIPGRACATLAFAAGLRAEYTATSMALAFNMSASTVGMALNAAGYTQAQIFAAFSDVFVMGPAASIRMANTYNIGGVTAEAQMRSVLAVYGITDAVALGTVVYGSLSPSAWIPALRNIYGLNDPQALAATLLQTPVPTSQIGMYLQFWMNVTLEQAIAISANLNIVMQQRYWMIRPYFATLGSVGDVMRVRFGASAQEVAPALYQDWLGDGSDAADAVTLTIQSLQQSGYTASEVTQAIPLVTGEGLTPTQLASTLRSARFKANEVALVLRNQYNTSGDQTTATLKGAGYVATEVGNALTAVFSLTVPDATALLQRAGYSVDQSASYLSTAEFLGSITANGIEQILVDAGYASSVVRDFLLNELNKIGNAFVNFGEAFWYDITHPCSKIPYLNTIC